MAHSFGVTLFEAKVFVYNLTYICIGMNYGCQ